MTIQAIKKQIIPILKDQGVIKAAFFGSFATGNERPGSDVDLLVKFNHSVSLMDLSGLKLDLEDKVGRKFDVLTYNGIHPRLKKIILKEQKIIYDTKRASET